MQEKKDFRIRWDHLDKHKFASESEAARSLADLTGLSEEEQKKLHEQAKDLVQQARSLKHTKGVMESFLEEFGLSNKEGLALMCLAEALLRVPDSETADRLIAEKISSGNWGEHAGQSDSWLVNASVWGLMMTGRLVSTESDMSKDIGGFMQRLTQKLGEPVIRAATRQAIRLMGEQFVFGRSIKDALKRTHQSGKTRPGFITSYDMLGEGARTQKDAERYTKSYDEAIATLSEAQGEAGDPETKSGISVKLSALHPRYETVKEDLVFEELYPRLRRLAEKAAKARLNFCLDAEEADRLILSLKLFERLAQEPFVKGWTGLGLAVQAYQKRALGVIERLARLAQQTGGRFMVRLVKGAYWDTEIKHAQQEGSPDYPVWTTKTATDLNYLACARALFQAKSVLFPQFATHNAHTLVSVMHMAHQADAKVEFQRLHGMGAPLYEAAENIYGPVSLRVYAPVGRHEDLLPYLVRRLLENGANTSFVHSFLDDDVPVEHVVQDPFGDIPETGLARHKALPHPTGLFGEERLGAAGWDLTQREQCQTLKRALEDLDGEFPLKAGPLLAGQPLFHDVKDQVTSPVDHQHVLGSVSQARKEDIEAAFVSAKSAQKGWDDLGGASRASVLRAMGDALEGEAPRLIALMAREAGKTVADAVAEVREAVDFCRYYAARAEEQFKKPERLPGPAGETNHLSLHGRGVFVCISPWNFPLAIFTGQIAAALAAGNTVLAKPAEQTPLIAFEAVRLFHEAGLPAEVLHLLPGDGAHVGAALTQDLRTDGVVFTGSTETARLINQSLAARKGPLCPFIAETGGLNGMFVDTTALREQVIDDVIISAFGSAGQRCSALRVLFVPEESADELIEGIAGAMDVLKPGDPADVSVDTGPLIDAEAQKNLQAHLERMQKEAHLLKQVGVKELEEKGYFFGPALIELPSLDLLEREVFGPVLHVIRYRVGEAREMAQKLAEKGYGLTLGVHSRLDSFAQKIREVSPVGNIYVNRSMTGAVVGVQPFGGEGLSGTGPKAGGPHYLQRFACERTLTINTAAQGGDPELLNLT